MERSESSEKKFIVLWQKAGGGGAGGEISFHSFQNLGASCWFGEYPIPRFRYNPATRVTDRTANER